MDENPFDDISETKRKLLDEVKSLFEELDALRLPDRYVDKKKVKKKTYKTNVRWFVGSYENLFLKPASNLLKRSISWGEIFYNRLLATQQLLPADNIQSYVELNSFYVKNALPGGGNEFISVGTSLESFLATHKLDIDNSILGACPPESVVYKYSYYLENHQNTTDHIAETTRESLRRHIITWAKMDDISRMSREVKRMASMLESEHYINVKNIEDGDLVLVALPGPKGMEKMRVVYGRIATGTKESIKAKDSSGSIPGRTKSSGRLDEDDDEFMISVHIHPDERNVENVSHRLVFPFTEDMTNTVESRKPVKMERLLEDPTKLLSRELNEVIKEKTLIYLERIGVDTEIVDRAQRRAVTIADLPAITSARRILLTLLKDPPTEFLTRIDELAHKEIQKFIQRSRHNDIFIPAREKGMKRLGSFRWSDLPKVRFQRQQLSCKDALEHLQLEKRELMNGTAKERVTSWWLRLIKDECDKFLERRGYHNDAVPTEYLEVPPAAARPIRDNLQLIREVLDPNVDKHRVKDMIKGLREKIYPKINRFISNAQIVIAEQFGIDFDSFTLEMAETRLEEERDHMEAQILGWIEDMIKDIKYLQDMQDLEDNPSGERRLDIVPVTGLIVGRFYRLENELRTVIEVWSEWFDEQDELERVKEEEYRSARENIISSRPASNMPARKSADALSKLKDGDGISTSAPLPVVHSPASTTSPEPPVRKECKTPLDKTISHEGSSSTSSLPRELADPEATAAAAATSAQPHAELASTHDEPGDKDAPPLEQLMSQSSSSSLPGALDPSLLGSTEGEDEVDAVSSPPVSSPIKVEQQT